MVVNILKSSILIGLIGGFVGSFAAIVSHYAFGFDIPIYVILPIVVIISSILAVRLRTFNSK